jgi:hypothetical protein
MRMMHASKVKLVSTRDWCWRWQLTFFSGLTLECALLCNSRYACLLDHAGTADSLTGIVVKRYLNLTHLPMATATPGLQEWLMQAPDTVGRQHRAMAGTNKELSSCSLASSNGNSRLPPSAPAVHVRCGESTLTTIAFVCSSSRVISAHARAYNSPLLIQILDLALPSIDHSNTAHHQACFTN